MSGSVLSIPHLCASRLRRSRKRPSQSPRPPPPPPPTPSSLRFSLPTSLPDPFPQVLSFTTWPTGEQCSRHDLTADVCPGTICTHVKLNSPPCPSRGSNGSSRDLLGMSVIINTLVETLIKTATNRGGQSSWRRRLSTV